MAAFRDFIVRLALIVSLLVPVYFLVAALGTKFGLLDWRIGFGLMTFRLGAFVLMGAAGLAILALLLALFATPRRGIVSALVALLIPGLGLGYAAHVRQQAQSIPPIHDISTDLIDPPSFSQATIAARAAVPGVNDLDLLNKRTGEGRAFTELQQEAYADIGPVISTLPSDRAWDEALAAAQAQGWVIGYTDAQAGVIEASASTFWYGFTDDIVIRVRPEGEGSRVDVRSVSRVGGSDLGANAARMRPYLAELQRRLGDTPT
ncbi:MAG: DUF1499 domain-containing protein [Hyphomonadaceae bacterium]|nr:DUF1499 domain-containing protein [Hyphomonadaceae bacterium]